MRSVVVGVDAGGSRTVAAAAASGDDAVRTFVAPAANPRSAGLERAAGIIAEAIAGALAGENADAIAVGVAGAGLPDVADAMRAMLAQRFPGARIAVTSDAHIALRGAIGSGDGIVLVAGTGSIAYAQVGGSAYRAGGAGYALGDEGSGYAIGSAALKLLLRSYEGRTPRDPFLEALAARIDADGVGDVIAYVYSAAAPIAAVAAVAPLVLEHANAGERSANKIVQAAALELFELVRAVLRMSGGGTAELPVAFSGGLLRENSVLTYLIETRIAADFPQLRVIKGAPAPYLGALAQARAMLS